MRDSSCAASVTSSTDEETTFDVHEVVREKKNPSVRDIMGDFII